MIVESIGTFSALTAFFFFFFLICRPMVLTELLRRFFFTLFAPFAGGGSRRNLILLAMKFQLKRNFRFDWNGDSVYELCGKKGVAGSCLYWSVYSIYVCIKRVSLEIGCCILISVYLYVFVPMERGCVVGLELKADRTRLRIECRYKR